MAPAFIKEFPDIQTNYRDWIHSEICTWHDNKTLSNAPYRWVLTTQLNHLASLAKWLGFRNVQNYDFFKLIISTVWHQCYLNNVLKTHLVELSGSLTTYYYRFLHWKFAHFLYHRERSLSCPCEKISSVECWQ